MTDEREPREDGGTELDEESCEGASSSSGQPEANDASAPGLYVVGLGASAGGLEALEAFFTHMPPDCNMAFVVVQHLSPDFKSMMDELLSRHTRMAVHRVEDGMPVEPNAIYLIPPKKEMIISDGKLLLTDKDPAQALTLPIDIFFRSLAQDVGHRGVAIVLSGTGSDGSRGICNVHDAGGLVLAQSIETAKFDGMPLSALETGVVDLELPPERMPEAIQNFLDHTCGSADRQDVSGIDQIIRLLRQEYSIDFSYYKENTLRRRIERRLTLNRASDLSDYVSQLRESSEERHQLYKDLLIGVTKFFRDRDAFERLGADVVPELLTNPDKSDEVRIWVAGCATGEEAYSLAILLKERMEELCRSVPLKIFATDVHKASLDFASAGKYSEASLSELSRERVERYFTKNGDGYTVIPELRQMIVFAPHNVIKDAPFTRLDMVTCRNLLIYLQPPAQKKALSLFHFGLRTGGVLFLGPSESPGEFSDEFETLDAHWKIYRKTRDVRLPADMRLPLSPGITPLRKIGHAGTQPAAQADRPLVEAQQLLLSEYAPPSLLVDKDFQLLHTFRGAGKYLRLPEGESSLNVLDMAAPELKLALGGALQRAAKEKTTVSYTGVRLSVEGEEQQLKVTVRPIAGGDATRPAYLASLQPHEPFPASMDESKRIDLGEMSRSQIHSLEDELQFTKENLQATLEEMETANEELQATNEELVASNEELQSTNEELHSVNEELYTVNAEYQRKIAELTELNTDMDNLFASTEVGTIFLDRELKIRKFTPQIADAFHLVAGDIGRSIETFAHTLDYPALLDEVKQVLKSDESIEREIRDRSAAWFLLRILPYRAKGRTEGVVVNLIDISLLKQAESRLRRMSTVYMEGADPIIIEDLTGKILDVNHEAERVYGYTRGELIGKHVSLLVPQSYRSESEKLRRRCRQKDHIRNVESVRRLKNGTQQPVLLTLSLLADEKGEPAAIATIAKDITRLKQAEQASRDAVRRRDQFLAMLSHELRNPLSAVLNAARVAEHQTQHPEMLREVCAIITRQGEQMSHLLNDLLDVSRVTQGKIELHKQVVDLTELVRDTLEAVRPLIESRRHAIDMDIPDEPVCVEADPARVRQVLDNLVTNAAKYTPAGGRIEVRLSKAQKQAVLEVADNGDGIEPELLERIFEPFFQMDSTLDRSQGGMGMGLTLAQMLVELHGGEIVAHSAGSGRGSTFTVRLPVTRKKPKAPKKQMAAKDLRIKSIVVVEDSADSREMLRRLLQAEGFDVAAAADGEQGLQAILESKPDLALVDIGLPKLDGYEVARRARSGMNDHAVRLVALTGYGQAEDTQKALQAGFDRHLVKPLNLARFYQVLSDLDDGS